MVPASRTARPRRWRVGGRVAIALAVAIGIAAAGRPAQAADTGGFNRPGNIYIADQFNNRIIEVDAQHNVVWHFGDGSSVAGPTSVVAPNDAERVGNLTLISGTGAPPGSEPTCPNGCPDDRVILVNPKGKIIWQYGITGVPGSGFDMLNTPVCAVYLPNQNILITDQGNQRVIEVTLYGKIVWQYGTTGVPGSGYDQLNNPNSAELLSNGDILIADESNNRAIEVNRDHQIVWSYSKGLNTVAFASRLSTGNTMITDSGNNRIIEVDPSGTLVYLYKTNTRPGSVTNPNPTRALRLLTGNVLISDQFNHQVIELDSHKNIVFSQGMIGVPGNGFNQLNAPYDAKVVGDYNGITPP